MQVLRSVISRYLCSFEKALSRRPFINGLPKGVSYSRIKQMLNEDWNSEFAVPLAVHPVTGRRECMEVSMHPAVWRNFKQWRQAHPNAANFEPLRVVERGSREHLQAFLKADGGAVYLVEDPANPRILEEGPFKALLQGYGYPDNPDPVLGLGEKSEQS